MTRRSSTTEPSSKASRKRTAIRTSREPTRSEPGRRRTDRDRVLELIRAAAGAVTPSTTTRALLEHNPDFGTFEWMVTILAIEIELRVEIDEKLARPSRVPLSKFAEQVAAQPRITDPAFTIDRLNLLVEACLASDAES